MESLPPQLRCTYTLLLPHILVLATLLVVAHDYLPKSSPILRLEMPPIEVFEPTHKVQLLFELFRRGSRQPRRKSSQFIPFARKQSEGSKSSLLDLPRVSRTSASERQHHSTSFTSSTLSNNDSQHLVHDHEYYCDPSSATDDQCCTLKVETTLFRVLRIVLCRDNSAFSKRLWFGRKDCGGVFNIPGEADRFRDLLWVLHTMPPDFHFGSQSSDSDDRRYTGLHDVSLSRLLNIAELAHDYSFPSFQRWAVEKIYRFLLRCSSPESTIPLPSSATSSLSSSSSMTFVTIDSATSSKDDDPDEIYGRILKVSLNSKHPHLLDLLVQRLVVRILWYDYLPGPALMEPIIRNRSHKPVDTLLGVINYRMLVDLPQVEHRTSPGRLSPPQHVFPREMPIEQRMEFLAAHHSLTSSWKQVRENPPELRCQSSSSSDDPSRSKRSSGSSMKRSFLPRGLQRRGSSTSSNSNESHDLPSLHVSCGNTWKRVWRSSCRYAETRSKSRDDILGMLKVTMLRIRKVTADDGNICLDCALEGLEALDVIRDKVIDGLPSMFVYR
ncbi:hypothetical protein E1B28_012086 [Marasmius oreades]|uniref:Uncharacterized protein n=1 Tax=Marasmius oreades TaxID=181124 RepID=A0A9P7UNA8_9AGAR|nr:uncharacterized protein E1B28_012086 [Marasmius oreades]KAG7088053.1 hypothetical protein E1B28_012086 [Marasmius oreades]